MFKIDNSKNRMISKAYHHTFR